MLLFRTLSKREQIIFRGTTLHDVQKKISNWKPAGK
jgi:hypothetical protein